MGSGCNPLQDSPASWASVQASHRAQPRWRLPAVGPASPSTMQLHGTRSLFALAARSPSGSHCQQTSYIFVLRPLTWQSSSGCCLQSVPGCDLAHEQGPTSPDFPQERRQFRLLSFPCIAAQKNWVCEASLTPHGAPRL